MSIAIGFQIERALALLISAVGLILLTVEAINDRFVVKQANDGGGFRHVSNKYENIKRNSYKSSTVVNPIIQNDDTSLKSYNISTIIKHAAAMGYEYYWHRIGIVLSLNELFRSIDLGLFGIFPIWVNDICLKIGLILMMALWLVLIAIVMHNAFVVTKTTNIAMHRLTTIITILATLMILLTIDNTIDLILHIGQFPDYWQHLSLGFSRIFLATVGFIAMIFLGWATRTVYHSIKEAIQDFNLSEADEDNINKTFYNAFYRIRRIFIASTIFLFPALMQQVLSSIEEFQNLDTPFAQNVTYDLSYWHITDNKQPAGWIHYFCICIVVFLSCSLSTFSLLWKRTFSDNYNNNSSVTKRSNSDIELQMLDE